MAPGTVASAVICISSLPKRRLPSRAGSSHDVPAKAASHPRMRSSSTAWPTDSWICNATWSESRTIVVTPARHTGADSRAWACSAISAAWVTRSRPRTSSQPWVPYCPRTPGYDRRWVSPSPMAVASTMAPHSTTRWSTRLPSLDTNHFSVSHTWYDAVAWGTPASTAAPVAATSRSPRSASPTSSSGCSSQRDDHESTTTGAGDRVSGGPGTRAQAGDLGLGQVLDHPVAGLHRLQPDHHDPGVGVVGPGGQGGLDRGGGDIEH